MSPGAANLFPFFSEENNPLYLDPSERAANEAVQGNRDTAKIFTSRTCPCLMSSGMVKQGTENGTVLLHLTRRP